MDNMSDEMARLATFANWPSTAAIEPRELARAGFYYLEHRNKVRCFSCKKKIRNWSPGDNAMDSHKRNCLFVRNHRSSGQETKPHDRDGEFISLKNHKISTSRRQPIRRHSEVVNTGVPLMPYVSLDIPGESQVEKTPERFLQSEAAALPAGNAQFNNNYLSMMENYPSMIQDLISPTLTPDHSGRSPSYSTQESGQFVRLDEPRIVSEPSQLPPPVEKTTRCPISPIGNQAAASRDRQTEGIARSIPSVPGTVTRDYVRSEENRLQTLQGWPHSGRFDINRMAASGLFYTGKNDNIRCLFCSWNNRNLGAGLDPCEDHYEVDLGKCPLLRGDETDNVKRTRINSNSKIHIHND